ncbi:uncharacterized protein [Gossypium hirsutum]|uniref:Uncharacterized protein LOC107901312 isoform X3 n=1 Tax=Gossypium hirsutum TaxID=3635 RepID=A0A1U8IXD0_GOSHI|nr:uncharacterized protein LOC107901312 isoform X3 [Gossypium hirsutum]XP_040951165.1 uncharacterized protein LOC107901312 isoform X3 [Gossypium hirsutum]
MAKFGKFLSCLFAKPGIIPERLHLLLQRLIYTFKLNLMLKDRIITALPFRFPPLQSRFCRLGVGSNLIQLISYIFHFDEQKDQVAIEQILRVVFLNPKRPCLVSPISLLLPFPQLYVPSFTFAFAFRHLLCLRCFLLGPAANKKPVTDQQYQKGHQEALILGCLELISAEMIPFNP